MSTLFRLSSRISSHISSQRTQFPSIHTIRRIPQLVPCSCRTFSTSTFTSTSTSTSTSHQSTSSDQPLSNMSANTSNLPNFGTDAHTMNLLYKNRRRTLYEIMGIIQASIDPDTKKLPTYRSREDAEKLGLKTERMIIPLHADGSPVKLTPQQEEYASKSTLSPQGDAMISLLGINSPLEVWGWVRSCRTQKIASFIHIHDGTTQAPFQIVIDNNNETLVSQLSSILTGAALHIKGHLQLTPAHPHHHQHDIYIQQKKKKQGTTTTSTPTTTEDEKPVELEPHNMVEMFELHATEIEILGPCDHTYPLQKKYQSLEFLREHQAFRLRTNTLSSLVRLRNIASIAIHDHFQRECFALIATPILTPLDCEGAGELFSVGVKDGGKDGVKDKHFFGRPMYLTVSGQLYAEMAAAAIARVYTFGPTFRAENSHTSRHLCEFWMIEPEMAFTEMVGVMDQAELLVKKVIRDVLRACEEDELRFFASRYEPGLIERLKAVEKMPFKRITYTEAIDILLASGKKFEYPVKWGESLQSEHERYLAEVHVKGPVFVINYPRAIKPFYMRQDNPEAPFEKQTVSCFDLLVPGVGELMGGSQREERYDLLIEAMTRNGLDIQQYSWYTDLRKYGSCPHSGFGVGFERLLMYLTGINNARDVTLVPRIPGSVSL